MSHRTLRCGVFGQHFGLRGASVKDLIASVFINVDKSRNALDLTWPIKK